MAFAALPQGGRVGEDCGVKGVADLRKMAANHGITETGPYIEWLEERVLELQESCNDLAEANTENLNARTAAENASLSSRVGPLGL